MNKARDVCLIFGCQCERGDVARLSQDLDVFPKGTIAFFANQKRIAIYSHFGDEKKEKLIVLYSKISLVCLGWVIASFGFHTGIEEIIIKRLMTAIGVERDAVKRIIAAFMGSLEENFDQLDSREDE